MDMLANALSRLLPAEKEGFEQLLLEKGDGAAGRVMYVLRHNNRTVLGHTRAMWAEPSIGCP